MYESLESRLPVGLSDLQSALPVYGCREKRGEAGINSLSHDMSTV